MSQPSHSVPAWLKWTGRGFGALFFAGSLLQLSVASVALRRLISAHSGSLSAKVVMELLGQQAGQLAGGLVLLLIGIWLLQRSGGKKASPAGSVAPRPADVAPAPVRASRRVAAQRWHWCNVLEVAADHRRLWHFSTGSAEPALKAEQRLALNDPLPFSAVTKDWRTLWQRKLNIAWLPADQVFLRVVHLPKSSAEELPPMLELQLEKLSPLPVNQIVWSFELLPSAAADSQSVLLVIAARAGVEEFLGTLEQERYLADRLELPLLHQLVARPPEEDGTWLYLSPLDTKTICLAAWWYGGRLMDVNLAQVPTDDTGPAMLTAHVTKVAWGGEIEGWLTTRPVWNLVADETTTEVWEAALRPWAGDALRLHRAPTLEGLATLSAARSASDAAPVNLLPAEFSTRYRQQFIDQLWMRGLGAIMVLYLVGVLAYFGWLQVQDYRKRGLQREVTQLSGAYTNALRLKERVKVFQEQANLKSAALDCLRVTSELLPADLSLTQFNFKGGKDLYLQGTVTSENQIKVTEFNTELRKAAVNNEPLFAKEKVQPPKLSGGPGAQGFRWDFTAGLNLANTE
jgi:hypothetical protein